MPNRRISSGEIFNLSDQVALVTGAGRGVGRAIALRLAEAGARVTIVDVDPQGAERTAREIEAAGGVASFSVADVSLPADASRALDEAATRWGGVGILVNNAGVYPIAPTHEAGEEHWDRVLGVNLKGTFFFARAAAARMVAAGRGGSIVNIASVNAHRPMAGLAAYNASKAGVVMLTESLALEFGRFGVRANAIAPGGIKTPGSDEAARTMARLHGLSQEQISGAYAARVPLGRMGEPDEVALAALFLASPAAGYITGATLVVDGGYLLS
ncbi:MAG TPA: SDR family NAD(P)-dependent oxidoreductase [Polyangiaceae bacterium]|nr:SDR family NAD(P)-dependent oxidoreductase [Polyangiaceae bacterium]